MRVVFADSGYWIALVHRRDTLHDRARRLARTLRGVRVVTTESVLVEVLNYFAGLGPEMRDAAVQLVRDLHSDRDVEVIPQDRWVFQAGLDLYARRRDKGYSAVDCITMSLMRDRGVTEVLTHDHRFEQEQFVALLR